MPLCAASCKRKNHEKHRSSRGFAEYPREGQNTSTNSSGNPASSETGGAESGAVGDENRVLSIPDDPRLLALIDAWPMLSEVARAAVVRLAGLLPDDLHNVDDSTAATARGEGLLS